ncbi:hypothetical protein CYLTODRAFT_417072 [Cylindrobasidium torrendii FP15055 ss-10]|uniref:25S rRNA (uridine-N(3))-methyltransferase BMT5-like domain-containing protein n=1 Tax=Cylindrobasidium torrendii FP15055 ss-10 TaxID=1314674 RepID=A0A0D7BUU4_9AGAR|nr:hypothetical protein CYLTODRAFT_417072 [Cylindrobasidium torrendii FP15055 ss-10]
MGKSKNNLKAALQSQQSRQKNKDQATRVEKIIEAQAKAKKLSQSQGKAKGRKQQQPRLVVPFSATDTILLVGEGNFSFTRALVFDPPTPELAHLPPGNVTATAYDSEEECYSKYPESQEIVSSLRERGVHVLFDVDATKLEITPGIKGRQWDKLVWNFPHAGKGITDQDRNILSNQMLILDFFRSAENMLKRGPRPSIQSAKKRKTEDDDQDEDEAPATAEAKATRGSILLTLRNVPPYTLWNVPKLAKHPPTPASGKPPNPPYMVVRSFEFHRSAWKGYEHRMTKGERAQGQGKTGEGGEDRTWEFCWNGGPPPRPGR